MNVELHLGIESHSDAELQNEIEAHSNSEIDGNAEYLTEMHTVNMMLKDKMKKQQLSQDCLNMSNDIILQLKSLEIKMLDL